MSYAWLAFLLGLAAAVSWGVSDFFIAKSARAVGAVIGALVVNAVSTTAYLIAYLLFLQSHAIFTTQGVWDAIITGLGFGVAQALFFRAMLLGPVSIVSPVASTYPLISAAIGIIFFATRMSILQMTGIFLVVAGVAVASGLADFSKGRQRLGNGPLMAVIAALGWGIGFTFSTRAVIAMNWQSACLVELVATTLVLACIMPFIKGDEPITMRAIGRASIKNVVLAAGIIQAIGLLAVNIGIFLQPQSSAVIVALSSCYPILTIFLALRHLKERVPLPPLIGAVVGVAGIVVLSLG